MIATVVPIPRVLDVWREAMLISLFVLARIVANPLSNVFQKQLTQRDANPVFIIGVVYAFLTVMCLPLIFGPASLNLRLGSAVILTHRLAGLETMHENAAANARAGRRRTLGASGKPIFGYWHASLAKVL